MKFVKLIVIVPSLFVVVESLDVLNLEHGKAEKLGRIHKYARQGFGGKDTHFRKGTDMHWMKTTIDNLLNLTSKFQNNMKELYDNISESATHLEHMMMSLVTSQETAQVDQTKRMEQLKLALQAKDHAINVYRQRLSALTTTLRSCSVKCDCLSQETSTNSAVTDSADVTDRYTEGLSLETSEVKGVKMDTLVRNARAITGPTVAFSAYLDREVHRMDQYTIIQMAGITLNDGNAYSSTTGIFNAPANGVYLFFFSIEFILAEKLWVNLVVDGNTVSSAMANPNHFNQNTQATNVAVLRLTIGQSVWLAVGTDVSRSEDRITWNAVYRTSTFSGVYLHP